MSPTRSLIAAMALAALTGTGSAADFPSRTVTMIVPFAAGGGTDITSRTLATAMADHLGVNVVVRNVSGAAGTIGTAETASARADGYTIGMIPVGPMTTQPHLRRLPYDIDSFDFICLAYEGPTALAVARDSPMNTLADLIAAAEERPGELLYATPGPGSIPHIAMMDFAQAAGIDLGHLPQSSSAENMQAILSGNAFGFVSHMSTLAVNRDSLKALGVMMPERVAGLEDVPTFGEQGHDLVYVIWGGLVAPRGIPEQARQALEAACETAIGSSAYHEQMEAMRQPVSFRNSADFEDFVTEEFERNGRLLEAAGLKRD